MRAKAVGRLDTEMSLRRSIADGDLRLHYQPIVTLEGGQVLGHAAVFGRSPAPPRTAAATPMRFAKGASCVNYRAAAD